MNAHQPNVRSLVLAVLFCVSQAASAPSPPGQARSSIDEQLVERLGFSPADLRSVEAGSAVVRSLDTAVREELAYVGLVHIRDSPEGFLRRFRHIEQFESGPGTPLIGLFSDPPQLDDLARLKLPAADVAALSTCRSGDCDVKLSAAAIARFQSGVNWSSPNADIQAIQANQIAREMILDMVRAYAADGNVALGSYDDGADPLPVAENFRALLTNPDPLPAPIPALVAYLDTYPYGRPEGTQEFFYWTLVDFGLKPTVRVNHVTVYPIDGQESSGITYAIATKQLYASHYFHTTLELRFLFDNEASGSPGTLLISITRSRSDGMTGFGGLFRRPIIARRSREAVRGYLEHVKRQVEEPIRATPDF